MKRNNIVRGISLLMVCMLVGCASYTPTLPRLGHTGPTVRKTVKGDLTLYVEEYVTPEKAEKAFDTDLANEGVLPLMIGLENNGKEPYEIKAGDIFVRGKSLLKGLAPEEVASRAERSAVGRALGWSLIVPIIGIPIAVAASAIHTNSVNKKIRQDFAAKAFTEAVVLPNKDYSGFLFFELEEGRKDLSGLSLEMRVRNVVTGKSVTIAVPLPAATITPKEESSSQEDGEASETY